MECHDQYETGKNEETQNVHQMFTSFHNTTISVFRGAQVFYKSRSHLKILGVKRISLSSILRAHKYKAPPYKIYWPR